MSERVSLMWYVSTSLPSTSGQAEREARVVVHDVLEVVVLKEPWLPLKMNVPFGPARQAWFSVIAHRSRV